MVKVYLAILIVCFAMFSCRKENVDERHNRIGERERLFRDSMWSALKGLCDSSELEGLALSRSEVLTYQGAPIACRFIYGSSSKRYIIIVKNQRSFLATEVDLNKLKPEKSGAFSGTIHLSFNDHVGGRLLEIKENRVQFIKDLEISPASRLESTNSRLPKTSSSSSQKASGTPGGAEVLPVVVVTPVRQSSDPLIGLYLLFGQNSWMADLYMPVAASAGSSPIFEAPSFISPKNPIKDIRKELGCFTLSSGSKYTASININEPVPKTRDVSTMFEEFKAGHAFISLEQVLPDGNSIVRNVGFYPMGEASLSATNIASTFGEDSDTKFSVSLSITLNSNDFGQLISTLSDYSNQTYNLFTFNCTSALISAFDAIGIALPSTKSSSVLFDGNSPADLAEDLRAIDLKKFSSANGGRKMVRKVSDENNLQATKKKGGCEGK
jgi:hypothetical protein